MVIEYDKSISSSVAQILNVIQIIYSNPVSDIVRSIKTTAYDQNNNIQ